MNRISLHHLQKTIAAQLKVFKVPEPETSCDVIFHKLGRIYEDRLSDSQVNLMFITHSSELMARRKSHEPLQYLAGNWKYRGLTLQMRRPVFIPRPQTLELVDHAKQILEKMQKPAFNILQVGSGSGIIPLLLAQQMTNAKLNIISIDVDPAAVQLSKQNLQKNEIVGHAISFECHDFRQLDKGEFDLIISNPPYIPSRVISALDKQVKDYESRVALDGGEDGMEVIRGIIGKGKQLVRSGGHILLQIDQTHDKMIEGRVQYLKDSFGRTRFAILSL